MSELKPTTDATFAVDVLQSTKPVIVDFTAAWCGPCQSLKPALIDLAKEYGEEVDFRVVDVDTNPELSQRYNVRGIPTLLCFRGGELRQPVIPGPRSAMARQIESLLAGDA